MLITTNSKLWRVPSAVIMNRLLRVCIYTLHTYNVQGVHSRCYQHGCCHHEDHGWQ